MRHYISYTRLVFKCLLLLAAGMLYCANPAQAALSNNYTVVCGQSPNGQPVECNLSTHACYLCERTVGIYPVRKIVQDYRCLNRSADVPNRCSRANSGGLSGNSDWKLGLAKVAPLHQEGQNCITENLMAMYAATCYSCEIVETLASAFIRASAKAYQVARQAGNAILVLGMILWIGLFVLKNISSFSTVEPMKMIQDLMVQLFKVYIAFVIVNSGIPTILHYTMEPIILAGTDWGDAIISANVGVDRSLTKVMQQELQQEQQRKREEAARSGGAK